MLSQFNLDSSVLKGEAVKCVRLAKVIASPLRGKAERSSDKGGISKQNINFCNNKTRL